MSKEIKAKSDKKAEKEHKALIKGLKAQKDKVIQNNTIVAKCHH